MKIARETVGWMAVALLAACSSPASDDKQPATDGAADSSQDGADGTDADGSDATDAADAADATDGADATDATDGADGSDVQEVVCDPACTGQEECIGGTCQLPVICEAGTWICQGIKDRKQCNEAGTGFSEPELCAGDQFCTSGKCGLMCAFDPKWGANVGCAFWTVDLPTWDDPTLPNAKNLTHAVVISNPSELPATVTFTAPPGMDFGFGDLVVEGLSTGVFGFANNTELDVDGSRITNKGIRVVSDRPVLVHQFNPWDNTYSNDASLLLPEPILGQEYLALSWPTDARSLIKLPIPGFDNFGGPSAHGFLTVVATQDDTEVFIRTTARINASEVPPGVDPNTFTATVPVIPAGGAYTFFLQKGEVLNLDAMPETIFETADLTGTLVLANKPVAVFSGHDSAAITDPNGGGEDSCCLDHLEEQLLPVNLLGKHYVAGKSKSRGGEKDLWRVVAAEDNVTITTTPNISGLNGKTLAKQGDWAEAFTTESFEITSTGKIQVGQYFVGQGQTSQGTGDPDLILAIPVELFRATYPIMVPPKYAENYVTVIRTPGKAIHQDGKLVSNSEFDPFAGGIWEIARLPLDQGFHTITGEEPFALSAYGYNTAAGYGYPGGLTIPGEATE